MKKILITYVGVIGLCAGCASMPPSFHGIRVDKEEPFVITQTEEQRKWGILTHPYVREVSDDRLVLTYWVNGDHPLGGLTELAWPAYSDDYFRTVKFGDPFTWESEPPKKMQFSVEKGGALQRDFHHAVFLSHARLKGGRYFMQGRRPSKRNGFTVPAVKQQERNGTYLTYTSTFHWTNSADSSLSLADDLIPDRLVLDGKAAVDEKGCMWKTCYGDRGSGRTREKYKVYLFKSCDEGQNFEFISTVATQNDAPWGRFGPCEPAILWLGNDELLVVMRTDGGGFADFSGTTGVGDMLAAISTDGGRSWRYRRMPSGGISPDMLKLANGLIVVSHGRPGNNLSFSKDNGRTWSGRQGITPTGWKTTGTINMIEVADNRLFVVFDQIDMPVTGGFINNLLLGPTGYVNAIYGMFINIHY